MLSIPNRVKLLVILHLTYSFYELFETKKKGREIYQIMDHFRRYFICISYLYLMFFYENKTFTFDIKVSILYINIVISLYNCISSMYVVY